MRPAVDGRPGKALRGAGRGARGRLAGWRGDGPPRRRSVAGLRGWPATLGLRTAQTPTGGSSEGSSAMGATLTERRRVRDEGPRVVNRFSAGRGIRTVRREEASANYVPAAAVIRRRRALSGVTGRKGCAGGGSRGEMKSPGLPGRVVARRDRLRVAEGRGIPGGAVKCVEIRRNTDGVGSALDDT